MALRLASPTHSRDIPAGCIGHVMSTLWAMRVGFYVEPNNDGVTIFVHESEAHVLDSATDHTPLALN